MPTHYCENYIFAYVTTGCHLRIQLLWYFFSTSIWFFRFFTSYSTVVGLFNFNHHPPTPHTTSAMERGDCLSGTAHQSPSPSIAPSPSSRRWRCHGKMLPELFNDNEGLFLFDNNYHFECFIGRWWCFSSPLEILQQFTNRSSTV